MPERRECGLLRRCCSKKNNVTKKREAKHGFQLPPVYAHVFILNAVQTSDNNKYLQERPVAHQVSLMSILFILHISTSD